MRDGEAAVTRNEARKFVRDAVSDALAEFDENHESTLVPSVCGDGELITEFGDEECDDGNLENGDGCDIDCQTE
jgi:cysteine-rich repeat protein